MKLKLFILLLSMMASLSLGQTTYLSIKMRDGTQNTHNLADINKITFFDGTSEIEQRNFSKFLPTKIVLYQNYPNPFNPTTTIKFEIPSSGFVQIRIFDMLGKKIKTIESEYKNAGTFQVIWNGSNDQNIKVSSGTYYYQIIHDNNILTKKLVLLK